MAHNYPIAIMKNPPLRHINRLLVPTALVVFAAVVATASVYARDDSAWLVLIAVLALSVPVCGVVSILNLIVFAPVFWLMAKCIKPKGCADRRAG
jgi:predicted lysophospholipase L1 biosynthesis ABC-type transport system permease subunit